MLVLAMQEKQSPTRPSEEREKETGSVFSGKRSAYSQRDLQRKSCVPEKGNSSVAPE